MARSTAAQSVQIGVEAVGPNPTAVPANRRLGSLSFELSPEVESNAFRPRGTKFPTVVAANKEWTTADLTGSPTYDELVYPLASVLTQATTAAVMDGATATGAYQHTFSPASSSADTPRTYTVETGDASVAQRAGSLLVTDFSMSFSRSEVTLSGSAFGRALETIANLTANPTAIATDLAPILPGQVCVYLSTDPTTLGTDATHIPTNLSIEPSIGGRWSPVWYLNCRENSYSGFVEAAEPDATVNLTAEANAAGLAWVSRFRTGETVYIRVEAKGPQIATGVEESRYRLTWDQAVKVLNPGAYSDEDGVYAVQPELQVVHSPSWGRALRVTVVNKVAAL